MQMTQPGGRVAYEPSSLAKEPPRESPDVGFRSMRTAEHGDKGRTRPASFADHYSQARMFYRSQTKHEQAHMASAFVFELSKVDHPHIRRAIVGHLRHVEEELAKRVASGLGLEALPAAPQAAMPVKDVAASPALQIIGKMKSTLEGRAVGILIADGSDETVISALTKAATDAGATVKIVAPHVEGVKLSGGATIPAAGQLAGTPSVLFDAVAIILSAKGAKLLSSEAAAIDFVRDAFGHLKAIAIDAGGQALLKAAGIVGDAGVVHIAELGAFIAAAKTRQWDREAAIRAPA